MAEAASLATAPSLIDRSFLDRCSIDLATTMQGDELTPKVLRVALLALALLTIVLAPLALVIIYKSLAARVTPIAEPVAEDSPQKKGPAEAAEMSTVKPVAEPAVKPAVKPAVVSVPAAVPLKNFGAIDNICWANAAFQMIVASPRLIALIEKRLRVNGKEAAFHKALQAYRAGQRGVSAGTLDLGANDGLLRAYMDPQMNTAALTGKGGSPQALYQILLAGGNKYFARDADEYVTSPAQMGRYYRQVRAWVDRLQPIVMSDGLASEVWKDGLTDQERKPSQDPETELRGCGDWYQPEVILGRCLTPSEEIIEDFHAPGQKATRYKLVSVICTNLVWIGGGMGHFWAVVRSEDSDGTVRYTKCNDSQITNLTQGQFQQEIKKYGSVACYERVD